MRTDRMDTNSLAHISHELRTPLSSMLGVLQLLTQTELTDTQRHYVELAQHSGDQLLAIINQSNEWSSTGTDAAPNTVALIHTTASMQPTPALSDAAVNLSPEVRERGLQILLADDNPVSQMVVKTILSRLGHTVVSVDNGLQVLDLLQQTPFDLLLLDVTMPHMDGLQVLAAIRKQEARSGLHQRVWMLTAHALPTDEARFLELGADAYLAKPISNAALTSALAALVGVRSTEAAPRPLGI